MQMWTRFFFLYVNKIRLSQHFRNKFIYYTRYYHYYIYVHYKWHTVCVGHTEK